MSIRLQPRRQYACSRHRHRLSVPRVRERVACGGDRRLREQPARPGNLLDVASTSTTTSSSTSTSTSPALVAPLTTLNPRACAAPTATRRSKSWATRRSSRARWRSTRRSKGCPGRSRRRSSSPLLKKTTGPKSHRAKAKTRSQRRSKAQALMDGDYDLCAGPRTVGHAGVEHVAPSTIGSSPMNTPRCSWSNRPPRFVGR